MSIYNFNFYLEKAQTNVKAKLQTVTTLILFARKKQFLIKYRTPFQLYPYQWDNEKQEAKKNKIGYSSINDTLIFIINTAKEYFYDCLKDKKVFDQKGLKNKLDIELNLKSEESAMTLFVFIEKFIKESAITKEKNTTKSYTSTLNHLKEFVKSRNLGKNADFVDVNLNFYFEFVSYLGSEKKLALNSIGKNIKNLKVFMGESFDRGLHRNDSFRNKKFKTLKEETDAIFLTEEELEKINKLDLSKNSKLDRVRDIFLVGCYTGLRFSDLERLTKSNIAGDYKYIEIVPKKTKGLSPDMLSIRIMDNVSAIFKKYNNQNNKILPPIISNQKMNSYLKDLGELAEITYTYRFEHKVGSKIEIAEVPKYTLITTHTARRSFATNSYLREIKPIDIMQVTGHRTETAFMRYIKMSNKDAADRVNAGWNNNKEQ